MKSLQVLLMISVCLILLVPLLIVESSSLNDTAVSNITGDPSASGSNTTRDPSVPNDTSASNITRGSSISVLMNDTATYWFSPSGNAAFGFYKITCSWYSLSSPFCADHLVVGIFFVKSSTLIWTTNHTDYKVPSSILFNNEGKLVLRMLEDNKEQQPLISSIQAPASYAMIHDNGTFVLYGSQSQVVFQSSDYPTRWLSTLEICLLIVKVAVGLSVLCILCWVCFAAVKAARTLLKALNSRSPVVPV